MMGPSGRRVAAFFRTRGRTEPRVGTVSMLAGVAATGTVACWGKRPTSRSMIGIFGSHPRGREKKEKKKKKKKKKREPGAGLEPATLRLQGESSTS